MDSEAGSAGMARLSQLGSALATNQCIVNLGFKGQIKEKPLEDPGVQIICNALQVSAQQSLGIGKSQFVTLYELLAARTVLFAKLDTSQLAMTGYLA